MKGKKTKMMRVDERLVHIFKAVAEQVAKEKEKPQADKWSKTIDKHMWFLCENLYPDLTHSILESYNLADEVNKNPIASEIIKND